MTKEEAKLYELIWKRTLASQMTDALVEVTTLDFSPNDKKDQTWITKGEVIRFDGFMKLYIEGNDDENEEESTAVLPSLDTGTILPSTNIESLQTFSKPPARYTEASLVKKLE